MQRALYGPAGFYRRERPADHFRTSAHASPLLAGVVQTLAEHVATQLGGDEFTVVDVGAGGGELLAVMAGTVPTSWRLVGVELRPRPDGLPAQVEWTAECEYGIRGLLIAHELLDNVPVDVVAFDAGAWRQVLVDAAGDEAAGPAVSEDQQEWLAHWWPDPEDGDRVEVGLPRDRVWADLLGRLEQGLAVAVDYPLDPERMRAGTLTGYRSGQQVHPVPDGSCDLTAHVCFESVAAAGPAGAVLMSQRDLLAALGLTAERPSYSQAQSDPAGYLRALSRVGELSELSDPTGLGGFAWLLQGRGIEPDAVVSAAARG